MVNIYTVKAIGETYQDNAQTSVYMFTVAMVDINTSKAKMSFCIIFSISDSRIRYIVSKGPK